MSLFLLFVAVVPALAQRNCPTIVLDTLNELGDNCSGLDRNAACYGFDRVDSTFFVPQPEGTFSEPTDRASLLDLATVQTYPLDEETGEFGAAVMNVQANVPNALPGQGVIFLLLGDATVEKGRCAVDKVVEGVLFLQVLAAGLVPPVVAHLAAATHVGDGKDHTAVDECKT